MSNLNLALVPFLNPNGTVSQPWLLYLLGQNAALNAIDTSDIAPDSISAVSGVTSLVDQVRQELETLPQLQEQVQQDQITIQQQAELLAVMQQQIDDLQKQVLPQEGDTNVSSLTVNKSAQVTGLSTPSSGTGVEILYDSANLIGGVQAYDRSGAAWKDISMNGANVSMTVNGGNGYVYSTTHKIAQFTGGNTGANFLTVINDANDPTIGTASAGAIKATTALQVTSTATPTAGAGAEIGYLSGSNAAYIQGYDRAGAGAWKNMNVSGLGIGITVNGGSLSLNGLGGFAAGMRYLIIDPATKVVAMSAIGPAS